MDILSDDISSLVFIRTTGDSLGNFSLDGQMLSVIVELDGRQSLGKIAGKKGFRMATMRQIISKMLQQKLIKPVKDAGSVLDKDFVDYLDGQLSSAVGPIAKLLIEDTVISMGCSLTEFPEDMAPELVTNLASQIDDKEKRSEFQRTVFNKIPKKGGQEK